MKKILLFTLSFCISHFTFCASAAELNGGVSFNVNSAREYIQSGQPASIDIPELYYKFQASNVEKVVTSYNNAKEVVGITVQYKGEPNKAYVYGPNNNLIYVDKYDKPVNIYPHRGYRYNMDGKLILTSLTVSKNELFRFSPRGNLIAHSVNGIIYDENGNKIGSGK